MNLGAEEPREMPMPESVEMVKEYVPEAGYILKDYEVTIKPLDCGCIVKVGCRSIAFATLEEALEQVNFHFKDPVSSYKKWNNRFMVK